MVGTGLISIVMSLRHMYFVFKEIEMSYQHSVCIVLGVILNLLAPPPQSDAQTVFLRQNWTAEERQTFYTTSQGSRMMPYDWFLALETDDGQRSFLRDRMPELGYLPNDNTSNNTDKLPVGFVLDPDEFDEMHVGMTCAACHTNQIVFDGTTFQIDGAPTLADMWGMLDGIDKALDATRVTPAKFSRFAQKVLGSESSDPEKVDELKADLDEFLNYWQPFIEKSRVPNPWGRGRLDAFGMIFNRVTSIDLHDPDNSQKPDAPVSYPFLWGTSVQDRVQWNGSADNKNDIERLGRNIGEVLGVFGQAEFHGPSIQGLLRLQSSLEIRTSAKRLNLLKLENQLKKLRSPQWPDQFPPINQAKSDAGKILFRDNCKRCHQIIPHGEQPQLVKVTMTPIYEVLTDPRMAVNAATGTSLTGDLRLLFSGRTEVLRGELLKTLVRLSLVTPFRDVSDGEFHRLPLHERILKLPRQVFDPEEIETFLEELGLTEEDALKLVQELKEKLDGYYKDLRTAIEMIEDGTAETAGDDAPQTLRYKSSSLAGIWATAPYLHNGSIPNLYELLSPVSERTANFSVGSNVFDPLNVGFKTDPVLGSTIFDTTKPGNSNEGHDMYGTFTEEQRRQLVEYMKSL